eukprot:gene7571-3096_t
MASKLPQDQFAMAMQRKGENGLPANVRQVVGGYTGGFHNHLVSLRNEAMNTKAKEIAADFMGP